MNSIKTSEASIETENIRKRSRMLINMIALIGVVYLGNRSYLMFHTLIEFFSIIVAFMMTTISFNTYDINKDNRVLFLGIAYGFIALFDLLHTLSFKGMGIFPQDTANLPTQLWIIARYMESISLLIVLAFPNRRFSLRKIFSIYSIISMMLMISVFYLHIFPDCYLDNSGLTPFKVVSEYIISGILLVGIFLLLGQKHVFSKKSDKCILISLIATIISEICFVFYISSYDLSNLIGHIFKLASFYCIYIALVESSLKIPHLALQKMNRILLDKNNELEDTVNQLYLENGKRKKAEDEALKGKEVLNAILEVSSGGILVAKNNGKIIHFNKQFIKIWGDSDKIVYGADIDDVIGFVKEKVINKEELEKSISKEWNTFDEDIFYLQHKNGKLYEVFSLPFIDKDIIAGRVFSSRDITDRKKIKELQKNIEIKQQMLDKAKEYDDMKTNFFSTVSHEFKTPLNIILGSIQLITNLQQSVLECSQTDPFSKYMKMMKQNCNRLLKLVNNIVDITKIDSGFMQMSFKNHDIVSIIEDITLYVAEYANTKNISIVFDTDIEERIISCDDDKLERVMLNLLSNAIKYTEPGGRIDVLIKDGPEKIYISVKDTGIGIPSDKMEIVFDRFRQVDSSLRREKEGSGIGLSLVKSLIELHNGKITLNSELDKGSEFIIELPAYIENFIDVYEEVSATKEANVEKINVEFSDIYYSEP